MTSKDGMRHVPPSSGMQRTALRTGGRFTCRPSSAAPAALLALFAVGCADGAPSGAPCAPDATGAFTVVEATIATLQTAITGRRVTCRQVVQAHLDRIAALDRPLGLRADVAVHPEALARADAIDARVAAGAPLGPLFCVPVLVKDNFDVRGLPTTAGSSAMVGNVPLTDAFMVERLVNADAIVLAKTNMAEWAFFPWGTHSSSYGTTANAYALDRSPAGSSGGTASGVAASLGVVGLGTDTGNSIRGPSSHLALFGLRSTMGLASRSGVVPLFLDRDVAGPMTRTVEDGARLFDVISAFDEADPLAALGRDHHPPSYTAFLDANGLAGKHIGVIRALVPPDTDPEVKRLFEAALADLTARGAVLVDPFAIDRYDLHVQEDTTCLRFRYDVNRYLAAHGAAAPFADVATVYTSGQYSPDVKEVLKVLTEQPDVRPDDLPTPCPTYPSHPGRKAFLDDVVASMDRAGVDVLVYPSWNRLAPMIAALPGAYAGDNSQVIAPSTGLPAATVPMGFSTSGLPAGLQIVGRPFTEGTMFTVAYAYEQATLHRRPPPLFCR